MRAVELIERFNEAIRLTQDAWKYDGWIEGLHNEEPVRFKRSRDKHEAADAAAKAFCKLLSDNESR
jgi:hypothetical protein